MQSILIILSSISLLIFVNFFFKKKSFLVDNKSLVHKSFTSKESVPLSGGIVIFFNLALFSNNHFILLFFFLIFILGIFSDLLIITKPLQKFIVQFLVVFFFLNFLDLKVLSTKIYFIDFLIKNNLFAILFTSFCCGYGKMSEDNSIQQIIEGICDYSYYKPVCINKNIIIKEANLYDQPRYYQNTEFFSIKPDEIVNC